MLPWGISGMNQVQNSQLVGDMHAALRIVWSCMHSNLKQKGHLHVGNFQLHKFSSTHMLVTRTVKSIVQAQVSELLVCHVHTLSCQPLYVESDPTIHLSVADAGAQPTPDGTR